MAKDIYVGSLISERTLEHSSGPWKKHKYIKKIGDRYVYAKNKMSSVIDDTKHFINTIGASSTSRDFHTRRADRSLESARREMRDAESAEIDPYRERSHHIDSSEEHRRFAKYDKEDFERNRQSAREAHSSFAKTGAGKIESAKRSLEKKITRRKRVGESAAEHYKKESHARRDAENLRNTAANYKETSRSGRSPFIDAGSSMLTKSERDRYAEASRNASRQAKQKEREATTHARLKAARESELERNSIKQRSERAKKRVAKALGRFKKKK